MGYRAKLAEQARARELRADAWTLNEIAAELGVSKSSVSLWVRDLAFTPRARINLPKARNRPPNALQRRKQDEIDRFRAEGLERIGRLSDRDLLIAGTALYAGEGSKRDGKVGFANTNPAMMRLFCLWLRSVFDIDEPRLRIHLYLHQGLDLDAAMTHWSAVTTIPLGQFGAPYRAVPDASIRTAKHEFGCATVSYSCSRTHRAIMGLVNALLDPSAGGT